MSAVLRALVLAWASNEPAVPEPPPIPARWELEWDAPPACPTAAQIREQVAALVPKPGAGEGVLYVEAKVEPRDGAFVLGLRTRFFERQDQREVRARACDELAEAVTLVVAISLDPALATGSPAKAEPQPSGPEPAVPEPDPAPSERAVPEPAASNPARSDASRSPGSPTPSTEPSTETADPLAADASVRTDARPRPRRSRQPTAWMLRLAPKLEIGTLPALAGGLDLAVGVHWRWWRLELHGAHTWPREVPGPGGSSGRFQFGAVGARVCGRPRAGPVELPVCAGLDGGVLRADGEGLEPATTVHGPWLAPSLGVGLSAGGARVAFWTLVEGSARLVWSRILADGQTLFRQPPVSGRWLAGVELRFAVGSR